MGKLNSLKVRGDNSSLKKHIVKWPVYKFAKWLVKTICIETILVPLYLTVVTPLVKRKARNKIILNGVNVIGYAKKDFGIAEHMRLVSKAMNTTDTPFCLNDKGEYNLISETNEEVTHLIKKDNPYLINLFCFNSDQTIRYMKSFGGIIATERHYNIGYGYWELSKYPKIWEEQNKYLSEIWAPSRYIKDVLEKSTNRPVHYMPIPVDFNMPVGFTRQHFKLPENVYLFLFTFDLSSFVARKNPQAVIQAFIKAFPVENGAKVGLVIKVNRIKSFEDQTKKFEALKEQVAFDKRIILIDEVLDRASILGLINVCDAYVSLHRSEGFGLGMAEAMKMGKVVIATNYSGNTDFMNHENSCPVNYKLIKVEKEEYCFVEDGAEWADPDIEQASGYMRDVFENVTKSEKIGNAAKAYIENHHNFNVIGENYKKRINEIFSENSAS